MSACEILPTAEKVTDWCDYIERAQDRLGKSGDGQRSGTIVLTDRYPLKRELVLDSLGACFVNASVDRASIPLGRWAALRPDVGHSIAPWYPQYIAELHRVIPVAIARLERQGYYGVDGQTAGAQGEVVVVHGGDFVGAG